MYFRKMSLGSYRSENGFSEIINKKIIRRLYHITRAKRWRNEEINDRLHKYYYVSF